MPCPHYSIKISSRGKGQSAVAQAAYQSGDRLYNERDHRTKYYGLKQGILFKEILLPWNAPGIYMHRDVLWNSVEKIEPNWNSQLARRIEIALPVELPIEKSIEMIRQHCLEQFVSQGMIADIAIHDPSPPGHNPHAHVMLTMRPIDDHGNWMEKSRKEYVLDENGNRIKDKTGKWKTKKVCTTDWDDRANAEKWRHEWEVLQNRYLQEANREERVDMRSYERQEIDQVPMVHLGPAVTAMERRGIRTDIGNLNREIRRTNKLIAALKRAINSLIKWIHDLKQTAAVMEVHPKEVYLTELLIQRYDERKHDRDGTTTKQADVRNAERIDPNHFSSTIAYMEKNGIQTLVDLDNHTEKLKDEAEPIHTRSRQINKRLKTIETYEETVRWYEQLQPIHKKLMNLHWQAQRIRYEEEYKYELAEWNKCNRLLRKIAPDHNYDLHRFSNEYDQLLRELDGLKRSFTGIQERANAVEGIRYYVRELLPELFDQDTLKQERIREELQQAQRGVASIAEAPVRNHDDRDL